MEVVVGASLFYEFIGDGVGGTVVVLGISEGELGGGAEDPSRVGELHVRVKTEGSGHVREGDTEVGELVVDMTSEPIKYVSALGEDGGGVGVRVPGGGTSAVGEVPAEESDCSPEGASTRVSCFKENVMEDVGDMERF